MRKRIAYHVLFVLSFLSTAVFAQESSTKDDIVLKATKVVVFQMTANLKLTQDQISAVQPIIANNIAKVRNLQQNLEDGTIDSSTMYSQRQQLIDDEDLQLGSVLTPDQMRVWIKIQNLPSSHRNHSS